MSGIKIEVIFIPPPEKYIFRRFLRVEILSPSVGVFALVEDPVLGYFLLIEKERPSYKGTLDCLMYAIDKSKSHDLDLFIQMTRYPEMYRRLNFVVSDGFSAVVWRYEPPDPIS